MDVEKLSDAELKLMTLIWAYSPIEAKDLAVYANRLIGWNKNTTYSVANKLAGKGAIDREEPGFVCVARATRESVLVSETNELVEKLCHGSIRQFFQACLGESRLSWWDLEELAQVIEQLKQT